MIDFIRKRIDAFTFAFEGWGHVLRTQRNAWIHAVASIVVFTAGYLFGLNRMEWMILIITVSIVWTAEFINTAIEAVVDLTSPEIHPLAKVAKDVGAAAVLIAAITAGLIGIFLFGPYIFQ